MSRKVESISKELLEVLGKTLDDSIRFKTIIHGFPEPNQRLKYPAVAIQTGGKPEYHPTGKWIYSQDSMDPVTKQAAIRWVVGWYEWKMQLDVWESTREERDDILEKMFQVFHSDLSNYGLSLNLTKYHNALARYDFNGYNFSDDQESSQRREWRATISVLAHCYAIVERKQYIMETVELTEFDMPDEIIP